MLNKIHPGILDAKKKYDKHYDLAKMPSDENENTYSLEEVPITITTTDNKGYTLSPPALPLLPPLPTIDTVKEDVYPLTTNTNGINSKKKKNSKNEQAITWAESLTIDDIVLTENGLDVHTLGGKKWGPILYYVKRAFMRKNNITVPQNIRKDHELGKVVSNHITNTSKGKKFTKPLSKEEKEQAIIWAESLTIDDVVLTENKLDVYTLGGKKWSPLLSYVKLAFMKKNNIIVPQYMGRKDTVLGKVVSHHINPQACPLPKDGPYSYVKESSTN